MESLSDYMQKPEPSEVSTAEIVDFYSRYGDKKTTAARYCLTVKELNQILKTAKSKTGKNTEVGMSRSDFWTVCMSDTI
mgnify:CR=1 FL=1